MTPNSTSSVPLDFGEKVVYSSCTLAGIKLPEINVLIDAREFEGMGSPCCLGRFQNGYKDRKEFKKVAIVGNKPWGKRLAKVGGWFIDGEAQYFLRIMMRHQTGYGLFFGEKNENRKTIPAVVVFCCDISKCVNTGSFG